MRTLRLSLVGTVILALLGGLSGAVVAQSEEASEPTLNPDMLATAIFDGTASCQVVGFGTQTETDLWGSVRRDFVSECTETMSDPRVSGTSTTTWDADCSFFGCVTWGTFELVGPDGSWVGTFTHTLGHGEGDLLVGDLQFGTAIGEGTGAYEGWAYVAHSTSSDPYMKRTVEGFVFPGDPPPRR
jgi:hypothetical protein